MPPFGPLVRPLLTAGAVTAVLPPDGGLPLGTAVEVTHRVAAPLFGRAYLEAIADAEIEPGRDGAGRPGGCDSRAGAPRDVPLARLDHPAFGVHAEGEAALSDGSG